MYRNKIVHDNNYALFSFSSWDMPGKRDDVYLYDGNIKYIVIVKRNVIVVDLVLE